MTTEPARRRAVFTLADQGLSSVSNFAVGVIVAKLAGPAGLGVFALAYASWQLLVNQHRALVTDPMAIEGDARGERVGRGALEGLSAELIIGVAASAGFALLGLALRLGGGEAYGAALLAVAPWLPALVVQDYWRWIGFMSGQPSKSLANDLVFDAVEAAAFVGVFLAGISSGPAVIAAWGAGALTGAAFGLWQFGLLQLPGARRRRGAGGATKGAVRSVSAFVASGARLLRRRWKLGRWIAGESILAWVSSQGYIVIAGFMLGPVGLGGLKAAQQLVTGPSMVLIQSAGSLGLPEASRAYDERGWPGLVRVTRIVTAFGIVATGLMGLVVAVAGRSLLTRVYTARFAHLYWTAVLIGIAQTIAMSTLGPLLVMKVTRNTRYLVGTTIATLPVSVIGVAVLCHFYGVDGAAYASIASAVVGSIGVRWFQHRSHRSISQPASEAPAAALALAAEAP